MAFIAERPSRDQRSFRPFADHADDTHVQIHSADLDGAQLGDPKSGRVKELEHGPVP